MRRTAREMISDRVSLVAAGCAFYATLALFPAITMMVFIYGLAFDPRTVEPQLRNLRDFLPPEAFALIAARVHMLVQQGRDTLGLGLLVSTVIALWSSMTGTKAILAALNMAAKQTESRSFLHFQLVALLMTLGAILGAVLGLAFLVGLPAAIQFLGLSNSHFGLLHMAALLVLLVFITLALALLYRFGPAPPAPGWRALGPGILAATLLWLALSTLFSFYVARIARYDLTYGPLGAAAGVMMWFYVTAYVVLLGAELNAALRAPESSFQD